MEEQQTQPTRLLARDVMRADLFSPAAKARLEAALAMSQAERLGAFREAAFGWAKMWAPRRHQGGAAASGVPHGSVLSQRRVGESGLV